MAGIPATGIIVRGNTHHDYFQNSFDLWLQDAWSLTPKVTLNFGARYTYPGVLGASDAQADQLPARPGHGLDRLALSGRQEGSISPRVGVTYVPWDSRKTVIRGGYGLFYDMFAVELLHREHRLRQRRRARRRQQSGRRRRRCSRSRSGAARLPNGVPVFGTTPQPPYGAFAVSQDLKLPYVENFNVNVEQQIGPATDRADRLRRHARPSPGGDARHQRADAERGGVAQARRPFNALYPELAAINELESIGRSQLQLAADVADSEQLARPVRAA